MARTSAPGRDQETALVDGPARDLGLYCGLPRLARQAMALAVSFAFLAQPILTPIAQAQQISDPRAPIQFRPGIASSANGTPVVNITTPSFGGISHNKFQRYDVDTRGVILNNSGLGGTSVIGGAVGRNPNLVNSRPASVIVNEVTGAGTSTLNGPTEVFGSRADVVVANPNGVGCVGCTFINAGRVTLTTGVPNPNYTTGVVSYSITGGTVSVSGAGLSGGNGEVLGRIDLLGRQLRIAGPVVSNDVVRLRAGAVTYDQSGDFAAPIAGAPSVSGPAISSTPDGTIRAASISILSRDVDLGVELNGQLSSLAGSTEIRSYGDLRLAQSSSTADLRIAADGAVFVAGRNEAVGRISISGRSAEFALGSTLAANDSIVVETLAALTSRGTLVSGQDISLTSRGALVASGVVSALGRVVLEGQSVEANELQVGGGAVSVAGLTTLQLTRTGLASKGDLTLVANDITLGAGTGFEAAGRMMIDARSSFSTATILDYPNLDLSVRNQLRIAAGGGVAQDVLLLNLRDSLTNDGILYGRSSASLTAPTLTNSATGVIYGPDLKIELAGALTNLGRILSDRTLSIVAGGSAANEGTIQTGGSLSLQAASYTSGSPQAVLAGASANLVVAGAFESSGTVLGQQSLTLRAASLRNAGNLVGGGLTSLAVTGDVDNSGAISSTGALSIVAGGAVRTPGHLYANGGDMTLSAGRDVTVGGDVLAAGRVAIRASDVSTGTGARVSGSSIGVEVAGLFANLGTLVSSSRIEVGARSISSGTGAEVVAPTVKLAAADGLSNAGSIATTDRFELSAGGAFDNRGLIAATSGGEPSTLARSGTITSGGDVANAGQIQVDETLLLRAGGNATLAAKSLLGAKGADVAVTGRLDNAGDVVATGGLAIAAASLMNRAGGQVAAGGSLSLTLPGSLENAGRVLALGDATLKAGAVSNTGEIAATDLMQATFASLTAAKGSSLQAGAVTLAVAGALSNGGELLATNALSIVAGGAVGNEGSIQTAGSLALQAASYRATSGDAALGGRTVDVTVAGAFENAGKVSGQDRLSLRAASLRNAGSLVGGGTLTGLAVTGDADNTGTISATGALSVVAGGALRSPGHLYANGGDMTLSAGREMTVGGDALAAGRVAIRASDVSTATAARVSGSSVGVDVAGRFVNLGLVVSSSLVDVKARTIATGSEAAVVAPTIRLAAADTLSNAGSIAATDRFELSAGGGFDNRGLIAATSNGAQSALARSGTITAGAGLTNAGQIQVDETLFLRAGGDAVFAAESSVGAKVADIGVAGRLDNAGDVVTKGGLTVAAASLVNRVGAQLAAGGSLSLTLPGSLDNAGRIVALADATLQAGAASNTGEIAAAGLMRATFASLTTGKSSILQAGTVNLTLAGALANAGELLATNALSIVAGGAVGNDGTIQTAGSLALQAASYRAAASEAVLGGRTVDVTVAGVFENAGKVTGQDRLSLRAASLINSGLISGPLAPISVTGDFDNAGTLSSTGALSITAGGALRSPGHLYANGGDMALSAGREMTLGGDVLAAGGVAIRASDVSAGVNARVSGSSVGVDVAGLFVNLGTVVSSSLVDVKARTITNGSGAEIVAPTVRLAAADGLGNAGVIAATDRFDLSAGSAFDNRGLIAATSNGAPSTLARSGTITAGGDFANAGQIQADETLLLRAGGNATFAAGSLVGARSAGVGVAGRLDNAGDVVTTSGLTVAAASLVNRAGAQIAAGGSLSLMLPGSLENAGRVVAQGDATLKADAVSNTGEIAAAGLMRATFGSLTNGAGSSLRAADLDLAVAGGLTNAGEILGPRSLGITAGSLVNQAGGTISSERLAISSAGALGNAGTLSGGSLFVLASVGDFDNTGAIKGTVDLTLRAGGALTNSGQIQANGALDITAASLANAAGGRIHGELLGIALPGALTNSGSITANDLLLIQAASLDNRGTDAGTAYLAADRLGIAVTGLLSNGPNSLIQGASGSSVVAGSLSAGFLTNSDVAAGLYNFGRDLTLTLTSGGYTFDQSLTVAGDLRFQAAGDIVNNATLAAGGVLQLASTGGSIVNNPGAELFSLGDMTLLAAGDVSNVSATIQSLGALTIGAASFRNERLPGMVVIQENALPIVAIGKDTTFWTYHFSERPTHAAAVTSASGDIAISVDSLVNRASTIVSGGAIAIQANSVSNEAVYGSAYFVTYKVRGANTGFHEAGPRPSVAYTPTISATGDLTIASSASIVNQGTLEGSSVTLYAPSIVLGITDPNLAVVPPRVPNGAIDLSNYLILPGGRTANAPTDGTLTGNPFAGQLRGAKIAALSDAERRLAPTNGTLIGSLAPGEASGAAGVGALPGVARPAAPVRGLLPVPGLNVDLASASAVAPAPDPSGVTYLHSAPLVGGSDRSPSWILREVGDARRGLTFFADPTTESRLLQQAIIDQTGRSLLDPSYLNPKTQRDALYQGTVDFLRQNPEVRLGDQLSAAQKASLTKPMIWYERRQIEGREVLVPVLMLPPGDLPKYAAPSGGLVTGENIAIIGDRVVNTGSILARDDLSIAAGTFLNMQRAVTIDWSGKHGTRSVAFLQDGGVLSARNVTISTLGDLTTIGGRIAALQNVTLQAGGNVNILAQQLLSESDEKARKVRTQTTTLTNVGAEIIAGADLKITSLGGDVTLQAAHLSGRTVTLTAADMVNLLAAKDVSSKQVSGTKTGLLTQKILDHGKYDETLVYTKIDGTLTVQAAGVSIDYEANRELHSGTGKKARVATIANAVDGQTTPQAILASLSGQAGLGWMAQLSQGPIPVSYNPLTTVHRSWNNDKTTLSPAAAALISVVVAAVMPQFTAGLFSGLAGGGAVAGGGAIASVGSSLGLSAATSATLNGALTAGLNGFLSSVVSGSIVGAINDDFDIGRILAGAATAGLTNGLTSFIGGSLFGMNGTGLIPIGGGQYQASLLGPTVGGQLLPGTLGGIGGDLSGVTSGMVFNSAIKIGLDASVRAGFASLLMGTDFGQALVYSLKAGLSSDLLQPVAFNIVGGIGFDASTRQYADGLGSGSLARALLHASIGAGTGALVGGTRGAIGGAAGAALSQLAAPFAEGLSTTDRATLAVLLGGLGSLVAGDVTMNGSIAALNGYIFNDVTHEGIQQEAKAIKKQCDGDLQCERNGKADLDRSIASGNLPLRVTVSAPGATQESTPDGTGGGGTASGTGGDQKPPVDDKPVDYYAQLGRSPSDGEARPQNASTGGGPPTAPANPNLPKPTAPTAGSVGRPSIPSSPRDSSLTLPPPTQVQGTPTAPPPPAPVVENGGSGSILDLVTPVRIAGAIGTVLGVGGVLGSGAVCAMGGLPACVGTVIALDHTIASIRQTISNGEVRSLGENLFTAGTGNSTAGSLLYNAVGGRLIINAGILSGLRAVEGVIRNVGRPSVPTVPAGGGAGGSGPGGGPGSPPSAPSPSWSLSGTTTGQFGQTQRASVGGIGGGTPTMVPVGPSGGPPGASPAFIATLGSLGQIGRPPGAAGYTITAARDIVGPAGGRYVPVGLISRGGEAIYYNNGAYYIFRTNGTSITSATRFNPTDGGHIFERQVLEATGIPKNTQLVSTIVNGVEIKTIPDGLGRQAGGVLEAKYYNATTLRTMDQISSQIRYARSNNMPYNLVVGPNTRIDEPLLIQLQAFRGSNVYQFDPGTGQLTTLMQNGSLR